MCEKFKMFPYSSMRKFQDKILEDVRSSLEKKKCMIIHAPTGLGKTVSTLAPALEYTKDKKLTIFFLTSRHTQHKIAIETLRAIKEKNYPDLVTSDIIGKKWLCLIPESTILPSHDFNELCQNMREKDLCEFYSNFKSAGKVTVLAKKILDDLKILSPIHTGKLLEICKDEKLCPYEMACLLASVSKVVIADYYYLFHPKVRDSFFKRMNKEFSELILIIDEGHNLPERIRELGSQKLSSIVMRRAIKEAKKNGFSERIELLSRIQRGLVDLSKNVKGEKEVSKIAFMSTIGNDDVYEEIVADFDFIGDMIRENQKVSYIGSVSAFLDSWRGPDTGYVRFVSLIDGENPIINLYYKCLDPSLFSKSVLGDVYSAIIMSGTLLPLGMYKDLLGFPKNTECRQYDSPFPSKNKLSLIVPQTTTKFTMRTERQFENIAKLCEKIICGIPGNVIVFFPSYNILNNVFQTLQKICMKNIFKENSNMTKEEKFELLESFKSFEKVGAVLLAVISANYAEGIDLPGDLLKGVIIVGLPLKKPDLETKALIKYYEEEFESGWDYGYMYPAFNKAMQSAGRCIRSETDKGVVVFLDERYAWPMYRRYFPEDYDIKISRTFIEDIENFFKEK